MWQNMARVSPATIRRMRCARWITRATDTHSEYVILITFSRQQWLRELASMVRLYEHYLSCLYFRPFAV
jgi:hypothetical protein